MLKKYKTKILLGLRKTKKPLIFCLIVFLLTILSLAVFNLTFLGRVNPGISVAGNYIGGKNPKEAIEVLKQSVKTPEKIILIAKDQKFEIVPEVIEFSFNFTKSAENAFNLTRTGNFIYDFLNRISLSFKKENLGFSFKINEEKLNNTLLGISDELSTESVEPGVLMSGKTIIVEKGKMGTSIDITKLRALIGESLSYLDGKNIEIPFKSTGYSLTAPEEAKLKERAQKLFVKKIILKFEDSSWGLEGKEIIGLINPRKEYKEEEINSFISKLALDIERDPQNSVFVFEEGKVKEFTPSKDGYKLKKDLLKTIIWGNLKTLETSDEVSISLDIPVTITPPKIQNKDVNNLGIKELIGKGSSTFFHSISNRIFNISLSSSKLKGILVPSGEIFSFNDIVGDVSEATGFKQAYIIKEGRTILGDGGGVCQVSTTLFRAVLNAGLPIIERHAHAYRVSYYEQDSPPGLDATVYSPTADLKFKNDTAGNILIQPIFDAKKYSLIFEIYGTKDGRKSTIGKSIVTDISSPPEDLYQDDPTLPMGQTKQIDFKAWGAKVKFSYKVEKDEKTMFEKTFISNYKPWQAIYLRGTGPTQ